MSLLHGTHHVLLLDCSNEIRMKNSLQSLQHYLETKLCKLEKGITNNIVSLIWYTTRDQYGIVFEKHSLHDNTISKDVINFINRIPKNVQSIQNNTDYVGPLRLACQLAKETKKLELGLASHLVLQTSECVIPNEEELDELMTLMKCHVKPIFQCKTIVEYGYKCNRTLLVWMAKAMEAFHTFCDIEDELFQYNQLETALLIDATQCCKMDLSSHISDFHSLSTNIRIAYLFQNQIVIPNCKIPITKYIMVPHPDTSLILYDITSSIDSLETLLNNLNPEKAILQLVYLYVDFKEGRSDRVLDRLYKIADARLIRMYTNAYSKQEVSRFEQALKNCIFHPNVQGTEGVTLKAAPDFLDNALTLLEFLEDMMCPPNKNETYIVPTWMKSSDSASELESEPLQVTRLVFRKHQATILLQLQRPAFFGKFQSDLNDSPQVVIETQDTITLLHESILQVPNLVLYVESGWQDRLRTKQLPFQCVELVEDIGQEDTTTSKFCELYHKKMVRIKINLAVLPLMNRATANSPETLDKHHIAENYIKMLQCKAQLKVLKTLVRAHENISRTVTIPKYDNSDIQYQVSFIAAGCMTLPSVSSILQPLQKKETIASRWMKNTWKIFDGSPEQVLRLERDKIHAEKRVHKRNWIKTLYKIILDTPEFENTSFRCKFDGEMISCKITKHNIII